MKLISTILVAALCVCTPVMAQSLPPISASTTAPGTQTGTTTDPASRIMAVVESVVDELKKKAEAGDERPPQKQGWRLPLWNAGPEEIKHYYSSGRLSAGSHVDFLYGFGAATKTLRAELLAALFPNGLRLSLGAAVSAGGESESAQEAESAIDRLRAGGDFALRASMPLASVSGSQGQAYLMAAPALAFMVDGAAGAETVTKSNEWSMDLAGEAYGEWKALDDGGALFGFVRAGRQTVSPAFATKIGALNRNNWAMQAALGVQLGGSVRVSLQRFSRPRTTNMNESDPAKWRLIVQVGSKAQ